MIQDKVKKYAASFEDKTEVLFKEDFGEYSHTAEAMKYSMSDGGKRLRPFLMNSFYKLSGGEDDYSEKFELAIECIHTYSLIHDDLPCMDNDDMRRGKLSCHKAYGEEYALLAGDGLLTLAFNIAAKTEGIAPVRVIKAISILSELSGIHGMIGGQTVDLISEGMDSVSEDRLRLISKLKTGALIKAACVIGCTLAGADDKKLSAAAEYAEAIGLGFQIVDDILDVIGDAEKLGKPINSDAENDKSTFVSALGIEKCKELAEMLTEKAKDALAVFGDGAEDLKMLADYLCRRDY